MSRYFYGWYFWCQGEEGTAAVIPAVHLSREKQCCSIQVITPGASLYREYPVSDFRIDRKKGIIQIGRNWFSRTGISMEFMGREQENSGFEDELTVRGCLRFGEFTEPDYDIMGPFAYLPEMECRHAVYSMKHEVNGFLSVDDHRMVFQNGEGYMEGDSGSSFPKEYIWTQSFFPGGSVMIAAASVPLAGIKFTGTAGIVRKGKREYRFATYLGASVTKMGSRELRIRQGRFRLCVRFLGLDGNVLKAPERGSMSREIRENIACKVEYILTYKDRTLMHVVTDRAAAECEVSLDRAKNHK